MGILIEFAFYLVMELVMYNIGRAVIAVLSFGRARAGGLKEAFSTTHGQPATGIVVPAGMTQLIGVAAFSAFLIVFFAVRN
jgi:hypothetical protein